MRTTLKLARKRAALQRLMTDVAVTVDDAADVLGIDRKIAYRAVGTGEIPSIKIGVRPVIRVPTAALRQLLRIPAAQK
jgi:excisionase family DNA binding protein